MGAAREGKEELVRLGIQDQMRCSSQVIAVLPLFTFLIDQVLSPCEDFF